VSSPSSAEGDPIDGQAEVPALVDTSSQLNVTETIRSAAPTRRVRVLREALAIVFWFYVILKLFVFDVDVFLLNTFSPNFVWLLNFKFIILLSIAAVICLIFRSFAIVLWIAYVVFYPLIVLFWKIPRWIYKKQNWVMAFAILNAIASFFRSIKYNLAVWALCLTSLAVAFEASNSVALWVAAILLLVILVVTYLRRFILVFRPNLLFRIYTAVAADHREKMIASYRLAEDIRNLPVANLNENQLKLWTSSLEKPVLYNRMCLFVAKTLRSYQQSGMSFIYGVVTVLMLVIATKASLSLISRCIK
jgi:hypothetical protein